MLKTEERQRKKRERRESKTSQRSNREKQGSPSLELAAEAIPVEEGEILVRQNVASVVAKAQVCRTHNNQDMGGI